LLSNKEESSSLIDDNEQILKLQNLNFEQIKEELEKLKDY